MPESPIPLTAKNFEELKHQVQTIIDDLYQEKVAGAEVGDVFSIDRNSNVLTADLVEGGGIIKVIHELAVDPDMRGDVHGPDASTDNAIARFDRTTGKLIQNSVPTVTDAGSILLPNGTADIPAIAFTANPDVGLLYSPGGGGTIYFTLNGVLIFEITAGEINSKAWFRCISGAVDALAFTFGADTNTGFYRPGDDQIGIATHGVLRVHITDDRMIVNGAISSDTLTTAVAGPTDNLNVAGVNTVFIDCSSNDVTIGGFIGGVNGQVLHLARLCAGAFTAKLEHAHVHAFQKIYLHAGGDESLLTEYGGWVLVCNGTHWFDLSHSKHV